MLVELNDISDIKNVGKEALLFYIPGHCAGCKRAISILENKKLEDWTIYKVDAECGSNKPLVEQYGVSTAPTIVTFTDGAQQGTIAGLKSFIDKKDIFGE